MRRGLATAAVAAFVGLGGPALGQTAAEPSIAQFLIDADALVARGPEAVTSPEADALRATMTKSAVRARGLVAAHDGQPASACPPPPGQAGLSLGDIMDVLRGLPADQQTQPLGNGMAQVLRVKFPCK